MKKHQILSSALLSLAAIVGASPALAATNLIQNGSFELAALPGLYQTVNAGDTTITNWTVAAQSVDLIGSYWQASDGVQSIDNFGLGRGILVQSFATTAGQSYTLSFDLSANPDIAQYGGRPDLLGQRVLLVDVTGSGPTGDVLSTSYQYTNTTNTLATMMWESRSVTFVANSSMTTLSFGGAIAGGLCDNATPNNPCATFGPAVDNVSVISAIPEPGEWAMMIAGLSVVGLIARRRKNV